MASDLLLQHYIAGKFAIPIALPNHNFKPPQTGMWGKWQLMPTNNYKGNLRETEKAGILQITLFVPVNTKTADIEAKANAIVEHFGTEKQHNINGRNLIIMSSTANNAMPDGNGYYMQPISISYQVI